MAMIDMSSELKNVEQVKAFISILLDKEEEWAKADRAEWERRQVERKLYMDEIQKRYDAGSS